MGESEYVSECFACQYCERKFPLRIKLRLHEKAKHDRMEDYFRRNDTSYIHDAAKIFETGNSPVLAQPLEKATAARQDTGWSFLPSPSASIEYSSSLSVENSSQERNLSDVNGGKSTHEDVVVESTVPGKSPEHFLARVSAAESRALSIQTRPRILRKYVRKCLKCWRSFPVEQYRNHMATHTEKLLYRPQDGSSWLSTILKKKRQIRSSHAGELKLLEEVSQENVQNNSTEEIYQADPTTDQEPSAGTSTSELSSKRRSHTNSTVTAQEADKGKKWQIKSSHAGGLKLLKEVSHESLQNCAEEIYQVDPTNHHESSARISTNELSSKSGSHTNSTATVQEADKGGQERPQSFDYKCEYCCRQFARLVKLKAHLKLEHKVTEFQGLFRSENRRNLVPRTCTLTRASDHRLKTASWDPNRSKRLYQSSQGRLNRSFTPATAGYYKCCECSNFLKDPVELLRHFYQNHPEVFASPVITTQKHLSIKENKEKGRTGTSRVNGKLKKDNSEPGPNSNKYFQCILCDYKSLQPRSLTSHLTGHHKTNVETYLQSVQHAKLPRNLSSASATAKIRRRDTCPYCSRDFSARYLPAHIRLHTEEKQHSCHLCTKKFRRTGHLRDHLRSLHTNAGTVEEQGSADKPGRKKKLEGNTSSSSTNPASTAPAALSFANQNLNRSYTTPDLIPVKTSDDGPYNSQIASKCRMKLEKLADGEKIEWYCTECWALFQDLPLLKEHIRVSHGSGVLSSSSHAGQTDFHPRSESQTCPQTLSRGSCSTVSDDSCPATPTLDLRSSPHSPLEQKELPRDGRSVGKFEATEGSVLSEDDLCVYLCDLCDEHFAGVRRIEYHLRTDHCMNQSYIDDFIRGIDPLLQ